MTVTLDPAVKSLAQREAQAMLNDLRGVVAVVVSTADGFDIASAVTGRVEPARIAAMASSIAAIGHVVSEETQLGHSKSVTITTTEGFAYICSVNRAGVDLIINTIGNVDAILAQVIHRSNSCVNALKAA